MNLKQHYKYYSENLKLLDKSIKQIALQIRKAISEDNETLEKVFMRQYLIVVAAWLETRQRKLIFENKLFTEPEILSIYKINDKVREWNKIIELAFKKHYGTNLTRTQQHQKNDLINLVNDHFVPIINLRNRLAHGQWVYTFNSDETSLENKYMAELNTTNNISLQHKMKLAKRTADLIRDLVVSTPTFQRDYDKHWKGLEESKESFKNIDYQAYKAQMKANYIREKIKRNNPST